MNAQLRWKLLAAVVCLVTIISSSLNAAPGSFSVTSPGDTSAYGPFYASPSVLFQWNAASGASSYQLNVRDVTTSDTGPVSTYPVNSTTTSITLTSLVPGNRYKWNVYAYSGANQTGTSTLSSNSRWFKLGIPDLLVVNTVLFVSPNPIIAGNDLTVKLSIKNQGSGDAPNTSTRLQIKNTALTETVADETFATPAVSVGQTIPAEFTIRIPTTTPLGNYNAYCYLNRYYPENVVSNNYGSSDVFTVTGAPDLTPYQASGWNDKIPIGITQLAPTDSHSYNGPYYDNQTLYFNWASFNQGTVAAGGYTVHAEVTGTGGDKWNWSIPSHAVGQLYWLTLDQPVGPLSAGSHTFKVWVDYNSNVDEVANEGNNAYERTITVSSQPISIAGIQPSGGDFTAGERFNIRWKLTDPTSAVMAIKLEYSKDDGTNYSSIKDDINPAGTGYEWIWPDCEVATKGRIRVSALDSQKGVLAAAVSASSFSVKLPSGNPTATFTISETRPSPLQEISFDGSSSRGSPCSTSLTFSWDFGDGSPAVSGANVKHGFPPSPNGVATYTVRLKVTDSLGTTDSTTASVTVNSVAQGQSKGASFSRDPVNLANGNYVYEHVDMRLPGRSFPFEFKRCYNSKFADTSGLPLGFGWTHSYNIRLVATSTNAVIIFGDGHTEAHFLRDGSYRAEAGVYDQLTKNSDGTFKLVSKDQTERWFHATGELMTIAHKNGTSLALNYTDAGLLRSVTDTAGRNIYFNYSAEGLLTSIEDPIGRTIQYQYDQTNLVSVTDANNGTTAYRYNANHQMTEAFDARGTRFVHNLYDELQRVVSYQADAYTNQTTFYYDFDSRTTYVTNAFGKISIHRHDERFLITNIVDEAGNEQAFGYDANRNRTYIRDKNGNETRFSHDERGNVTSKIDALTQITSIDYDSRNNPTRRIDALTNITTFGYDSLGNLTSTTNALDFLSRVTYNSIGLPTILTDPRGFSTTNEYDNQGNVIAITDADGFARRFVYDLVGRKIQEIDALNRTNFFSYDNNDNLLLTVNALGLTNSYFYDANNNRIVSVDPRGVGVTNIFDLKDRLVARMGALNSFVSNRYDSLDRKIETIDARGNATRHGYDEIGNLIALTNALNEVTRFTYDPNGNQTSVINPGGHYLTNSFDTLNRKTMSIDIGISTNLTLYDPLGRVIATTNANGQITRFSYDAIGRITTVVDAANKSVSFDYDENGNRIRTTDPNGHTSRNVIDKLNRLIEQLDAEGHRTLFSYDAVGNLIDKTTPNGDRISYSYDALNRLTTIVYPSGPPVTFAYDAVGNRTKMTDSLGTTTWQYDLLSRPLSVTDPYGQTVANEFDANGNRVSLIYPGEKIVHYEYDALNRMTALTNWLGGVVSYSYDNRGNLVGTANANGSTVTYGYDDASRLVTLANRRPDATVIASYALALDGLGNPLQSTHEQPLFPNLPNQTNSYTYDSDNRLISIDGESVIHDGNGNLRSIGTNSFGYDFENRLIEFTLTHNAGAYLYDGLGNRLSASVNATVRRFVLDRMASLTQVLLETDVNNSPDAYYLYGIGLAQRITPAGETATYHFDIRGSTVAITDSQGIVTDSYAFDSFGVIVNSEGDSTQPFRYLGRYGIIDDSTGVYYARARYFNPQLGRFLTKDPVTGKESDSQSLNRFVYALNNPLAFADVTGLCPGLPYCGYDTANDEVRPPGFWGNLLFDTLITAGVGVFEDIAANALKLALRPFLRRAASTVAEDVPRIVLNKTAGEAAEQIVAKQLQVEGNTILGSHVGVRTSEGLRYIDHLIQTPNGSIVAVEVKSGGAVRSLEQIVKDFALGKQGGVFTGSGGVPEHLISDLSGRPIPTIVITVP